MEAFYLFLISLMVLCFAMYVYENEKNMMKFKLECMENIKELNKTNNLIKEEVVILRQGMEDVTIKLNKTVETVTTLDESSKKGKIENSEKCQSGTYGQHEYPAIRFPDTTYINFNPPFKNTPAFVYGMYLLDSTGKAGVRANAHVTSITKTGVHIELKTWAKTVLYGLKISWMACPK